VRRHPFLVFLAAVFAAKLVVLLQLLDHPLLQPNAGLDTTVYTQLASEVVAGNLWLGPGLYFVSPLYIYFLAGVLAALKSFTAARVLQIVLGTASVGCVFAAARAWFGERPAWVAAVLAALTGLFTFHEVLLLQAALDPFLTSAALAALACAFAAGGAAREAARRSYWFAAAGLAFGLQALNRPNVLIPAAAIGVLLLAARRFRPAGLMAAGLAVALLPAAVRNYAVARDWSPVSSHGGLNFYIGNNADADGTYHLVPGVTPNIAGQQADARRVAESAAGRKLDDGEVSSYFYGLGWSWISLHPSDALRLFARKLLYVFGADHIPLNYSYPFYAYDAETLLAFLFVGPWLLVPLGLTGLVLGAGRTRRSDYLIWVSFAPLYAVSVALFFAAERYRLPLLVPLCIGCGRAVEAIVFRARDGRGNLVRAGAALAAVLALAWPVNRPTGLDDGRAEERLRMAETMVVRDRIEDAERWGAKAEAIHPQPGLVHFRIGRLLIVHSRPEAAVAHLERSLQIHPHQPEVSYALGQALVDARRPREAIPHLEKALNAGVRVDLAGFDLARARAAVGDRSGALQVLQALKPANRADGQSWHVLGRFALQLQSASLAAAFLREAVAADGRVSAFRQDLGLALATMGRYVEAVAEFEQGVALDPADPAARLNLAVAYAESGRSAAARAQAQEALRLKPDYERARQFLRALK
jgi:tetratricopeptide (TPR) repeat protein